MVLKARVALRPLMAALPFSIEQIELYVIRGRIPGMAENNILNYRKQRLLLC